MKLDQKKQIVKDLNENFSRSKIVILTDYKGLDVTAMNDLRRKLREAEIEYKVVKNTLLIRASEETDVALIKDAFTGPSAVALSYDDPVAPAKVLTDFAKNYQKLEIKVGVMNGRVLDLSAIKVLSNLPSREVILSQLLSTLNGVPTSLLRTINGIPQSLLNVLQAIKEQKAAT
ncbi:50S ribosomal protein L10 [Thermodesulfobacteriota bacterium]|jgi:large subunit ribosomal protein L10